LKWCSATSPRCSISFPTKTIRRYLFEGLANIDGSVNVSATGGVSIAGKWDAFDNWSMEPPAALGRDEGRDKRRAA
jgi:hypothetical protein